jgi:thiosulfate/3-mercaptopyruvate sulfurtransferase
MGRLMNESTTLLISAAELLATRDHHSVLDCRFELGHAGSGAGKYREGHIPGAFYIDLEQDLSAPVSTHGGRHPLPPAGEFMARLAGLGIGLDTPVVVYDDSRFAFAARCWWMARALGYRNVRLLDGGWPAWLEKGGESSLQCPQASPVQTPAATDYASKVDIEGLRQALDRGACLVDSREERRYLGLEEPIDPIAGHIPGARNFPWQGVTDPQGHALPGPQQVQRWGDLASGQELVVYCGSGVTACVNILSLAIAGRENVTLYVGSWSDWCSYLPG